MNYNNINDYELVYQIKENDEVAYKTIFEKYTPMVKKIATDYYNKSKNFGVELDDLCQEGFFAISKALIDYDGQTSLFYTYVYVCIKREIEKYLKTFTRLKHKSLNESLSLNMPINDEDLFLEDIIPSKFNIEDTILYNDLLEKIYLHKYDFNFDTSLIYELKINNFTNIEIAILLELPYKKVDNTIRNIRNDWRLVYVFY